MIVGTSKNANVKIHHYVTEQIIYVPLYKNLAEIDGEAILKNLSFKFSNNKRLSAVDYAKLAVFPLLNFKEDNYFNCVKKATKIVVKLIQEESEDNLAYIANTLMLLIDKKFEFQERKELFGVLKVKIEVLEEYATEREEIGRCEGFELAKVEMVRIMKKENFTSEQIQSITGFSENRINSI